MTDESASARSTPGQGVFTSVLSFWIGYVGIVVALGFVTSKTIAIKPLQLGAWGLISSVALVVFSRYLVRRERTPHTQLDLSVSASSLWKLALGYLLGAASLGLHVAIVSAFTGPIIFQWVPEVGAATALIFFARFLCTSCMEELGFRGYALQRLRQVVGTWPAVVVTAVAFGLSHLLYGWDMYTIALGVIPGGMLWGMSAIATRGIAVPIGLHAAWNFASWSIGDRAETGLMTLTAEDDVLRRIQAVGPFSYIAIFGGLTLAFWFVHRRNLRRDEHVDSRAIAAKT